jgi:hypothetical protein
MTALATCACAVSSVMKFGVSWGAKAKNVTVEQTAQGWGDTWTGLYADSKLCLSYLMLQTIYGAPAENDTRYSPAVCIGCDMKVISGDPDPKPVSTSYVERHNLSMRMGYEDFSR